MTTISRPVVNATLSGATLPVPNAEQRVLIVGQQTSAATATSGELQQDVQTNTEWTLFGAASQLANAIDAYRQVNTVNPIDAIGLDDPVGTAAIKKIAFTAVAATEAGSLTVKVGEERNGIFTLPVAVGDSEDDLATALAALVQAESKCLMSAAVDGVNTNEVNLTAENTGAIGTNYPVSVSGTVAGVTYAVTAPTAGAGLPTVTDIFDVVGSTRYQTIIWPAEFGTSEIKTFLDDRFNVDNIVLDGVGCMVSVDSKDDLVTLGNANNSQSIVIFGEKSMDTTSYQGSSTFDSPLSQAAIFGGLRALRRSTDADISAYNVSGSSLDNRGGAALSSLPYANCPLPLPIQPIGYGWTSSEIDDLKTAGISVMGTNTAGNTYILGEVVTTYKTDSAGNPDLSWKYLNYVDTGSSSREYEFNNLKLECAQHRMTNGNVKPGRAMHNINSITSLIIKYYGVLSSDQYVLLRDGEENLIFFKENLTVTQNLATGLFTVVHKLPIVTQTRQINVDMSLSFSA